MKTTDAIQKIRRQFQNITDVQISDYQEGFALFNETDIKKLIEYFQETYEYQNPPKWAFFAKASYKLGIKKNRVDIDTRFKYRICRGYSVVDMVKQKNGKEKKEFVQLTCDTKYTMRGTACPNCHSTFSDIFVMKEGADSLPDDVIETKEDCHRCMNFIMDHAVELENDVHGPVCSNYGLPEFPNKTCGECKCKKCCENFSKYTENPWKYTDMVKSNNKDPMTWIMDNKAQRIHYHDKNRLGFVEKKEAKYKKPDFFGKLAEDLAKSKRMLK